MSVVGDRAGRIRIADDCILVAHQAADVGAVAGHVAGLVQACDRQAAVAQDTARIGTTADGVVHIDVAQCAGACIADQAAHPVMAQTADAAVDRGAAVDIAVDQQVAQSQAIAGAADQAAGVGACVDSDASQTQVADDGAVAGVVEETRVRRAGGAQAEPADGVAQACKSAAVSAAYHVEVFRAGGYRDEKG